MGDGECACRPWASTSANISDSPSLLDGLSVAKQFEGLLKSAFAASPAIVSFLLRRAVSDERYASSFSILTTLFAIGQALGPAVGGIVADHQGLPMGTATAALIIGIGALLAIGYGITQQRASTVAQQS